MQKLCRGSGFPQHVLSRATKTPKTKDKKRETIPLGKRAERLIYRNKMQISKTSSTSYAKQDRGDFIYTQTQASM